MLMPVLMFPEAEKSASGHGVATPPEIQRNG